MRIIMDNIIFSLQRAGGISVYWYELLKRLIETDSECFFYESKNQNIFRQRLDLKTIQESRIPLQLLRYLPFIGNIPEGAIFHSSYYRVPLDTQNAALITTVHDFTYEYFRKGLPKRVHQLQKGHAIRNSDGIICVSENTKRDLLKFYPYIDESNIQVIYNGVGEEFRKLDEPQKFFSQKFETLKSGKYMIFIGDRSSYKNFELTIDILKKFQEFELVVVGGREFSEQDKKLISPVENRIKHFRGMNGERLNLLYNNAFCLLYPSCYEGFGIPVVEAMKAGCPVIGVNTSSIPEVAGDGAVLLEKIDIESLQVAVNKLKDVNFRKNLIEKGLLQSQNFSWNKCFEETFKFYIKILEKKFG